MAQDQHPVTTAEVQKIDKAFFMKLTRQVRHKDIEKVVKNAGAILNKVMHAAPLTPLINEVKDLIDMVRHYLRREYHEVPVFSILAAVAALLYILNPLDLIPDFIPLIGAIDDAAVLGLGLRLIATDVDRFRKWRSARMLFT
jgi:uncharacterized membrane protein YkvA (DUF1232 family)